MKKLTFLVCFMCWSLATLAQTTEYFDQDWKRVSNPKKASYFRQIHYGINGLPEGIVRDYYINGQLQWEGSLLMIDRQGNDIYDGWCTWYYPNGRGQRLSYFDRGRQDSTTYYWDQSGAQERQEEWHDGKLHGKWFSLYPSGNVHYFAVFENGEMQGNYYAEYDESGKAYLTFNDAFDNNNYYHWPIGQGNGYNFGMNGGRLTLQADQDIRAGSYIYQPLPADANFSIETTIYFEKGAANTGQGIVWGFQDWNNYDYFVVTANGYFKAGTFVDGIDMPKFDWTFSNSLRSGKSANTLRVSRYADQYLFMVNSQLMGKAPFVPFAGNSAGVVSHSGAKTISFENFTVRQDMPKDQGGETAERPESGWLGNGSGILINTDGLIATNYHVIADAHIIEVDFIKTGKKYSFTAEVVKTDSLHDLALLRINDERYKTFRPQTLPYGILTTEKATGASIFALGYPMADVLGEEIKFTDGKISALSGLFGDPLTYQISVPIQPGNSGGPLFDEDGDLIGITNSKALMETQNVCYAIKVSYLLDFAGDQLVKTKNTLRLKRMEDKVSILSAYVPIVKIK